MITLEGVLFVAFLVTIMTCVLVSHRFRASAREFIEQEGGTVPWSMQNRLPIDVRQLRGPAVVPAVKSNYWAILGSMIATAYFVGAMIVRPHPVFVLMMSLPLLCMVVGAIYTYHISKPQQPDDGAEPQASA